MEVVRNIALSVLSSVIAPVVVQKGALLNPIIPSETLKDNLVSYHSLKDGLDSYGDLDLTVNGATTPDEYFNFDGVNDNAISTANVEALEDFTINFWIEPHNTSAEKYFLNIGYNSANSLLIYQYKSSPYGITVIFINSSGALEAHGNSTRLTVNTRQMITVRRTGSNLDLFLNKIKVDSLSNVTTDSITGLLELAYSTTRAKAGTWYDGELGELSIHNAGLEDGKVDWLYNDGVGRDYADFDLPYNPIEEPTIYEGFTEGSTLLSTTINQGICCDGNYYYVSPDHNTIEKRSMTDWSLVSSATHTALIGGLYYDSVDDVILTGAGVYSSGGAAYVTRINKTTLAIIETIDISAYTTVGINAIVRIGNVIYVGETAASYSYVGHWYSFDENFDFIEEVYSHQTTTGSYDFQDATVFDNQIIATDHDGVVFCFEVGDDGQLSVLSTISSAGLYAEGIAVYNSDFKLFKGGVGIIDADIY